MFDKVFVCFLFLNGWIFTCCYVDTGGLDTVVILEANPPVEQLKQGVNYSCIGKNYQL